jgi:DNA/RNA-binding domain of Phe-tRNA-synthetase-like protein
MALRFRYHEDILARFPNLNAGVILARGLQNGPIPESLQAAYIDEQKAVLERIGSTPLSELASMSAWRSTFRQFGVEPTQYRNAAESLLRRLTKKGDIPSINTLVDIGNLVSIRYALPLAVMDASTMQGTLTVHFADGTERYTTLGESAIEHPDPGEVVFSDEAKVVYARRWCWRQSDQSAARETTTDAIITVEAQHVDGRKDVEAALNDLSNLLTEYAGENFQMGILGKQESAIAF